MKDYIKIEINIGGQFILNCNYVTLEPYAPSNVRTFLFHQIKEKYSQSQIFETLMLSNQKIDIDIMIIDRFGNYKPIIKFSMYGIECILSNGNLTIIGLNYKDESINILYRQGVFDIYNTWGNDKEFTNFLPSYKKDYIEACLYYSGGVLSIQKRDEYIIDWDIILDREDFF